MFKTPENNTKRYDRRFFVKVNESHSANEWVQYAIFQGYTDDKFIPGILKDLEFHCEVKTTNTDHQSDNLENKTCQQKSIVSEDVCIISFLIAKVLFKF